MSELFTNKILLIILTIVTFNPIQPAQDLIQPVPEGIDTKCPICLENMLPVSAITNLQCNHTFHAECIDTWLVSNHTCPVCRAGNENAENPDPDPMLALLILSLDQMNALIQRTENILAQVSMIITPIPEVDALYRDRLAQLRQLAHGIEIFIRAHRLR